MFVGVLLLIIGLIILREGYKNVKEKKNKRYWGFLPPFNRKIIYGKTAVRDGIALIIMGIVFEIIGILMFSGLLTEK